MIDEPRHDVLIEYTRIGASVRVTAVDSQTGTEVVFQAPASASPGEMQQIAIRKLRYVMDKKDKT